MISTDVPISVLLGQASMTLFTDATAQHSHRVRMVVAEKGVNVKLVEVDSRHKPIDLGEINPYNTLPTLFDREVVLYESPVIMEYLDERFPHPPLLTVYPVERAQARLMMHRIDREWSGHVDLLMSGERSDAVSQARKTLRESLINSAPAFSQHKFFVSDEFSLVDCYVAPILWRLKAMNITLPDRQVRPIRRYMKRVFERDSFRASLTEAEVEMRE